MPTTDMITEILHRHAEELRALHVGSLDVFGSTARGESNPQSDVDLLVEFESDARVGLFHFLRVREFLSEILDVEKVDLAMYGGLHPALRDRILSEKVHVF